MSTFALRPWRADDLLDLVRHANDPRVAGNMTDSFPHPYTEASGRAFLERAMAAQPPRILAITVDDLPIGSIGVYPQEDIFRRNAEFGYWLAPNYWGQGLMSQAVPAMVQYVFANFPAIDRLFARPFGSNIGSQRVLEKCGFTLEARLTGTILKNDRIEDELIYAVRR